jgi:hypothetical protein
LVLYAEQRVEALRWQFEFLKIAQILSSGKRDPCLQSEATKTFFRCQSIQYCGVQNRDMNSINLLAR